MLLGIRRGGTITAGVPGAAETDVAHPGVDHLRAAGSGAITQAVRIGAQV
jgi:hypothetical protein